VKKKDKQGIIIITFSLLLVVLFIVIANYLKPKKLDRVTLCPIDTPVELQKIIVIDKSDKWEKSNTKKMNNWLLSSHQSLSAQNRLTILAIMGNGREGTTEKKVLFDKCNPGSEKECNKLYQNCRKIKKEYDNSFSEPLKKIEDILSTPTQASYSPLFETVVKVIDNVESKQVEIHMVSDFMENGHKFDFYNSVPLGEDISKESPLKADANISFLMNVIERRRHPKVLIDAVTRAWKDYFIEQNIKNVSSKRFFITD
jgi:hypothetical protein